MQRRDIAKAFLASATVSALAVHRAQAQTCTPPCYPQTPQELVPPANDSFPPGDVRRYGAVGDDSTPSDGAFANAIAANDFVYVPPGKYVFDATVSTSKSGVTIWAAGPCATVGGLAVGGTSIRLTANAGANASVFHWTGRAEAVHIHGIGFLLKSPGANLFAHRGLRFYELLASSITNCRFEGVGNSSDDAAGIEFEGQGTFTGAVDVSQNYFTNLRYGMILRRSCTTVRITDNELYGNNPNNSSLMGVFCENLCVGTLISGNTLQGWDQGIRTHGVGITQSGNYFEENTVSWTWVRGSGNAAILNTSVGDRIISGGNPVFPSNNVDGCIVIRSRNVSLDDAYIQTGRGFRSNVSDWTASPLKLGNYSLWVDASGRLRIKNGMPTSDGDGTVVGAQI